MNKDQFSEEARKRAASYSASEGVLSQIANVELLAIVGPTGVGKTTVMKKLQYPIVRSTVTREPRPNEKDHDIYHFRSDYAQILQEIAQGDFVQYVISTSGDFYGTKRDEYPSQGVCTMAIYADAISSFRQLGFKKLTVAYIMPPGYVEWMRRIGDGREDLLHRIEEARSSILTAMDDSEYTFILNDSVDMAVRDIELLMKGEPIDRHRQQLARDTGNILLDYIGEEA
jgi:guanylate kinase